jgi:hypothetical protein
VEPIVRSALLGEREDRPGIVQEEESPNVQKNGCLNNEEALNQALSP